MIFLHFVHLKLAIYLEKHPSIEVNLFVVSKALQIMKYYINIKDEYMSHATIIIVG